MHSLRIVYESLRDCVTGFLLIVAALAFASLVTGVASISWYMIFLCTGLLPFVWFVKKRAAIKFNWWEYLVWAIFIVAVANLRPHLTKWWGYWPSLAILAVSVGCFSWLHQTIRRRLALKNIKYSSRS